MRHSTRSRRRWLNCFLTGWRRCEEKQLEFDFETAGERIKKSDKCVPVTPVNSSFCVAAEETSKWTSIKRWLIAEDKINYFNDSFDHLWDKLITNREKQRSFELKFRQRNKWKLCRTFNRKLQLFLKNGSFLRTWNFLNRVCVPFPSEILGNSREKLLIHIIELFYSLNFKNLSKVNLFRAQKSDLSAQKLSEARFKTTLLACWFMRHFKTRLKLIDSPMLRSQLINRREKMQINLINMLENIYLSTNLLKRF